jgi:hypothetical protein
MLTRHALAFLIAALPAAASAALPQRFESVPVCATGWTAEPDAMAMLRAVATARFMVENGRGAGAADIAVSLDGYHVWQWVKPGHRLFLACLAEAPQP